MLFQTGTHTAYPCGMNVFDRPTAHYEKRRLLSVVAIALGAVALCATTIGLNAPDEDAKTACLGLDAGDAQLCDVAQRYQRIAAQGGWPIVPDGPSLGLGDQGPRVHALQQRLRITNDLETTLQTRTDSFGTSLEEAVRNFQMRHGLRSDGTVGPSTLKALNVSAEDRIRQIRANLERHQPPRPTEPMGRALALNVADFRLDLLEAGRPIRSMRAIVGRPSRPTPALSGHVTHVTLSPYWHVPHRLAVQDQLPLIQADPSHLSHMGLRVYAIDGDEEIDPATVDWMTLSAANFPYRLRQDPGPNNALGSAKFLFPNQFGVTLHGTPDTSLFLEPVRALSSGCVRIADPLALAEVLLRDQPAWTRPAMEEVVNLGEEEIVELSEPVPIALTYQTAWVDTAGQVQFRKDIYGRDTTSPQVAREASTRAAIPCTF